jgi:hypothetical protein
VPRQQLFVNDTAISEVIRAADQNQLVAVRANA